MPTKRTPRPRFDAETIRACGELLRCVDQSRSLRGNALAARISPSADHADVAGTVRSLLDELSLRQREIVVRCDVKGEPYAAVAKSLHVSERHVFRERRAALSRIAHRLLAQEPTGIKPAVTFAPNAFDVRLAHSEALENGGNWRAAAEILERLAADVALPEQRASIEVRLARLYRDADQLAAAYHHAELAKTLAARAAVDGDLQRIEADIAVAAVAMSSGDWKLADDLARRSVVRLRPWLDGSFGARVPNALAQALLLKTELLADSGGVDMAFNFASEACTVVDRNAVDPAVGINARAMAALTSIFLNRDTQRAEEVLWECYRAALAGGLIRESLSIATHISVHYRLGGRPSDAVRLLAPLLGTARIAGSGWVQAGVLSELMHASLDAGALSAAAAYAAELSTCAANNPLTQGWVEVSRARIHLARDEFAPALEAAKAGETLFARMGLGRYVGTSLRMQAEALSGLGELEPAQRTITRAIDVLKDSSHPRPLATAYQVMARITGRRQYAIAARKLLGGNSGQ